MRIRSLRLQDFGTIKALDVSFSDGIQTITGNNGEGKSTILKAISLALYNRFQGKLSDYIRWGSDKARIEIDFEFLNTNYQVTIEIGQSSTSRYLFNGSEEFRGSEAIQELERLLDSKRAVAATLAFEHEIDLITTTPSERREFLKSLYDLSFQNEIASIREDIAELKDSILSKESDLSSLRGMTFPMEPLVEVPDIDLDSVNSEIKTLSNRIAQIEQSDSTRLRGEERVDSLQKKIAELEKSIADLEKKVVDGREDVRKQEEAIESKKEELKGVADKVGRGSEELVQAAVAEIEEKKQILESVQLQITDMTSCLNDIMSTCLSAEDLSSIRTALDSYRSKRDHLLQRKEGADSGVCPLCGSEIGYSWTNEDDYSLQSLELSIGDAEVGLLEDEKRNTELREASFKIDQLRMRSKHIESDINTLEKNKSQAAESVQDHIASIRKEMKQSITSLVQSLSTKNSLLSEWIEQVNDRDMRMSEVASEIDETRQEIEGLLSHDVYLEEMKNLQDKVDVLKESIRKYEQAVYTNEERERNNQIQIAKERERDERVEQTEELLNRLQEQKTIVEKALLILTSEFPSFVLSRLVRRVERRANDFLDVVYPKYHLRFLESKKSLSITYGPNDTDIKLASGFEKQVASFAYKYALSDLVGYRFLILDEVDSSASESNSQRFYEALGNMGSLFDQMFVITHKPETMDTLVHDFGATAFRVENGIVEVV